MTKKLYIIIVVIVAAVLVVYWRWSFKQLAIEAPLNTSDINLELEGLDVNNLDDEFEQIDQELDTL